MNEILKAPPNVPEYSVSELSQAVRKTVEGAFGWVRVRGEISALKRHTSGHVYMTLKDTGAAIDGVIWRGSVAKLGMRPEDGMEVICVGRVTTYAERSKYQLVIERMELAGEGALLKLIEDRRKKLAAEGLFDEARRPRLPYLPGVIGVVTSLTGAVIRDILHRLADRFPRHVLIWPVLVQGEGAAQQIADAINGFNALKPGGAVPRPDLLIVARGGGSLEDLMPFNEEVVVRAAAASAIALISAVGHETDTTLIDYASWRAPTPTAAAERAVPVRADLIADIAEHHARLANGLNRLLGERRTELAGLARGLGQPRQLIEDGRQRLDDRGERLALGLKNWLIARRDGLAERGRRIAAALAVHRRVATQGKARIAELAERMDAALGRGLGDRHARLAAQVGVLESVAPTRVLERGYVLVRDGEGHVVTQAAGRRPGEDLVLQFHDGKIRTTVVAAPPKRAKPKKADQGSLI